MFKISKMADYALVLLYEFQAGNKISPKIASITPQPIQSTATLASGSIFCATGLAAKTGIPHPTVQLLLKKLATAGFLKTARGRHGGYWLADDFVELSIYDVVMAIDGAMAITDCVCQDGKAELITDEPCDRIHNCSLNGRFNGINQQLRSVLMGINLQQWLRGGDQQNNLPKTIPKAMPETITEAMVKPLSPGLNAKT